MEHRVVKRKHGSTENIDMTLMQPCRRFRVSCWRVKRFFLRQSMTWPWSPRSSCREASSSAVHNCPICHTQQHRHSQCTSMKQHRKQLFFSVMTTEIEMHW